MAEVLLSTKQFDGLNNKILDEYLSLSETPDNANMDIYNKDISGPRKGISVEYLHTPSPTGYVKNMFALKNPSISMLFFKIGGKIYSQASAGADLVDTGITSDDNASLSTAVLGRDVILSDGTIFKKTSNGVDFYDITGPNGTLITVCNNRLFVTGVASYQSYPPALDTTPESRIYYAKLGTTDFTIDATADAGSEVIGLHEGAGNTAMYGWFDNLVIFKEKSVHMLNNISGGPTVWYLKKLNVPEGTKAPNTVCGVETSSGSQLWYLGESGLRALSGEQEGSSSTFQFDSIMPKGITEKVEGTMNAINKDYIQLACACYHDYVYYLSFPYGSVAYNDYILKIDTRFGKFNTWFGSNHSTLSAICLLPFSYSGKEEVYAGQYNIISKLENGTDDSGCEIYSEEYSKWIDGGTSSVNKSGTKKEFKRIVVRHKCESVPTYIAMNNNSYTKSIFNSSYTSTDELMDDLIADYVAGNTPVDGDGFFVDITPQSGGSSISVITMYLSGVWLDAYGPTDINPSSQILAFFFAGDSEARFKYYAPVFNFSSPKIDLSPRLRLDIYKDGDLTNIIRTLYVQLKPKMSETIRHQEIPLHNLYCEKIKIKRSAYVDYRLYEFGVIYEDGERMEAE